MGKCLKFLRYVNVEPLLLLYGISTTLYSTVSQAFFTYKECVGKLRSDGQYGSSEIREYCLAIGSHKGSKDARSSGNASLDAFDFDQTEFLNQVQAATAMFLIVYQVVNTLPAIVAALFMGAWCDSHGRKPIILIATAGTTLSLSLAVIVACLDSTPLPLMLLAALIKSFTGGGVIINLAAFAMISDVATTRAVFTMRIGIASGMISLGGLLGSVISGAVLARWDNFSYIFLIACAFCVLAFLYAAFFIVETYHWAIRRRASLIQDPESAAAYDDEPMDAYYDCLPAPDYDYDPRNLICSMFVSIRESVSVLIRKRQGNRKAYLLTSLVAFMMVYMCEPAGVMNLYLKRPPLSFTDSQYSYYMASITASNVVGGMLLPVILKRFCGVSDIFLILLGIAIGIARKCIIGFSTKAWMIFLASGAGGISAMYMTGFRSYIPSLVQRTETGRLFAAISSVEYCGPMLSAVIVNNIYAATLEWNPGAVFVITALIATSIFLVVSFIQVETEIVEGGEVKWCDEEDECAKRRLSLYEGVGLHDLIDLYSSG